MKFYLTSFMGQSPRQGDKVLTAEGLYGTVQLFNNPLLEKTHVSVILGDGSERLCKITDLRPYHPDHAAIPLRFRKKQ